ncbi:MAG: methylaspartate ammonia-lyase [Eubacteriales bacterium]|nr:methylaspartate ammonia-lyase [Clostridiales bacterium]MDY5836273.1 methylaspartate ammonia-lyase [Eubacteriales bacterium]
MKIQKVICSAGKTGFYFDDQKAIKSGAGHDGFNYVGEPKTPGFTSIRQPGESLSLMLVLEDGQIAWGDCAAVQYSGAGGRDPLFLAEEYIPLVEKHIAPKLVGRDLDSFRALAEEFDHMEIDGKRLHTALRYGLTQALLDAVAKAQKKMMYQVVADEYHCEPAQEMLPIFTQSGDNRYENAEKMIIKQAQVLPHALINNVEEKLGRKGEKLLEYVKWLRNRVMEMRQDPAYSPIFHIDVYGTIGEAFGNDNFAEMAAYLKTLEEAAAPFQLRIEGPMDAGSKSEQIRCLAGLRQELEKQGCQVQLVADEWCNTLEDIKEFTDAKAGNMVQIKTPDLGGINNTIEAVLYCKTHDMHAYQGGTCNETDRSAQVCVQAAMATQPEQVLAKPGMGVDEGYMIVYNEMARILAYEKAQQ